jgi:predicted ATPase
MLGREREVAVAVHLLRWEGKRLLTLTGPGGVGKTRLAIETAVTFGADFEDGAIFIPLEEVVDAEGVRPAIAAGLRLREEPGTPLHETLVRHLEDRELLLVLDGFEHLMDAASLPSQLLVVCPRLKILITSRVPLHLHGEQELDVKPLPVPDPDTLIDLQSAAVYPSIALFVQRARQVKPGFELTSETAPLLAEICRRLDGLPLAIELAAAQIKLLSPQGLLLRLESALNLLTGGPRDVQPRQQTMRATLAWSYELLSHETQTLFRRLSVFGMPFGQEAAAAVGEAVPGTMSDVQHGLSILADSSLLSVHETIPGEPRYSMFETVREYGLELLESDGEGEAVRESLARYCVTLAETAEAELHGANQARWMARLDREHGTFLLLLRWTRESGRLLIALRIASSLWRFWYSRGYLSEGRRQLDALLSGVHDIRLLPPAVTAKALRGAAVLAAVQGDYARAETLANEGRLLYRNLSDVRGEAAMLVILGSVSHYMGDYSAAWTRYGDSLSLFRSVGDEPSISVALNNLANIAKEQGDTAQSIRLYEESLSIKRRLGDSRGTAITLNNLGTLALTQGAYKRAAELGEEALTLLRALGDKDVTAAIDTVARATLHTGDSRRAAALYGEGISVSHAAGDRELIAFCLQGLGRVAAAEGEMEEATTLYAAGEALRIAVGAPLSPSEVPQLEASIRAAQVGLGQAAFARAWERGTSMDIEDAISFARKRAA